MKLYVVIPCYQEEEVLPETARRMKEKMASLAGRVIVMNHGRVAMDGTPREVFARGEELRAIGLDVPQAVELAERLRERGLDIPQGVYQMEELRAAIAAAVGKGKRHA